MLMAAYLQGVEKAGQVENAYQALKWGSDYLLKCVLDNNNIVAQVTLGLREGGEGV